MIDRLLLTGIAVCIGVFIVVWRADEKFLNKIRTKIGISVINEKGQVATDKSQFTGKKE